MRRIQETEYLRVVMELKSALARVAFLEERQENSVPVEIYNAKVAENEALKKGKEALPGYYEGKLAEQEAKFKTEISERDKEIADLKQGLKDSKDAQAALRSENMDFRKQMDFWKASHFTASSEKLTDEMDRLVGRLSDKKVDLMVDNLAMINRINATHGNVHYKDADKEKEAVSSGDCPEGEQPGGQTKKK